MKIAMVAFVVGLWLLASHAYAGTGNLLVDGSIGVGTVNDPVAKLEVNGEIKVGNSGLLQCSGSAAGAMRYNSTSNLIEFCNGSVWTALGGGTATVQYTITVGTVTGGTISPSTSTVNSGGSKTFTITPSTGFSIGSVSIDGVPQAAVPSFTFSNVTGNHSITANFVSLPSDTTAPTTTATPAGGTYSSTQTVTLSANEAATIYYSTDGSTPTVPYTVPVAISSTKTLKYFARDTAGNAETVKSQTYTIGAPSNVSLILPTLGPAGYSSAEWYVMEGGATLYHSCLGSTVTVTTGSTVTIYNFLDDGAEIRAVNFDIRDGGNTGAIVASGIYDSATGPVTATFTPANGHTYYVTTGDTVYTQY